MGKYNLRGKPINYKKSSIPVINPLTVAIDKSVVRSLEVPLMLKRRTDTGLDISEWANAVIFGQERVESRVYDMIMNNEVIPFEFYTRVKPPNVFFITEK